MWEKLQWIWFSERKFGTAKKSALLDRFSSMEHLYHASEKEYIAAGITEERHRKELADKRLDNAEQILERCLKAHIQVVHRQDPLYPERLRQISDAPILLYYKGNLPQFDHEAVIAVVGSRSHTAYGRLAAERLSYEIAAGGGYVISGLARGLDAAAHRGALKAGRPTAAVLGCGPDVVYPKENARLYEEIAAHGCILSEYPPGTKPFASHFPERNRIVSGLSLGVLVVEAGKKSGALITANLAADQGRDVFAVPGNIDIPESEGTNGLIQTGAKLVTAGWDVLSEYQGFYPNRISARINEHSAAYTKTRAPSEDNFEKSWVKDFTEAQRKIILTIAKNPLPIDEIIEMTGLTAAEALAELTILEIAGSVKQLPGKRFCMEISI